MSAPALWVTPWGSSPCFDGPDAAACLVAEHGDAAIRRAEVREPMDRDGPLRNLGLVVAEVPLTFLLGFHGELAGERDVAIGPPRRGPTVSLTCRNLTNIVFVSSWGTIQRIIIGPLNGCSSRPSSQIGATCCKLGKTFLTIHAQTLSPTRRGGDINHAHRRLHKVQLRQHPELIGK
jgi:hypothetical protein